jgi:iron complex outermembrane recepter protein
MEGPGCKCSRASGLSLTKTFLEPYSAIIAAIIRLANVWLEGVGKRMATESVHLRRALIAAALITLPAAAFAQQSAPAPAEAEQGEDLMEVVVTGTSLARAAHDTPLAATTLGEDQLAQLSSSSQADILNSVPTIKAEGGGGEVAANVFIKGLPSSGQYQFTPLEYDGIPVFSTFGLNSSAFDVFYRNDLGIERLEFVRGGVSNLFGPGSVAGVINYISKTGGAQPESKLQLEVAEDDRVRADFALNGPVGSSDNLFYAVSGFYRTDDGPIRTGNDTKGYQLRGNLKREFEDGSSITVYGQYIDDQVQFYLPFPLDGNSRNRVPGNDGRDVFSVQTHDVSGLGFAVPGGNFTTSITDGVVTKDGSVALAFDKKLANGWGLNGKTKYARYNHRFDFFLDGDGIINRPETLQGFLTNRNLGSLANASFTYTDTGEALPGNYLLFPNRFIDRDRPARDVTGELNLTKGLRLGAFDHSFTLGTFYSQAKADDFNVTTTYLADFNNEARLVDLTVNNTVISQNGLLNAGAGYVNNHHEATRYAAYLADQMQSERFIFDVGARIEKLDGDIRRERTATFITDATTPSLAPALRDVIWGTGNFANAEVDTTEWAIATGALYKLTDPVNLYVNAARGYFFPEIRSVALNAQDQPQSYTAEIIKQAEAGVKYRAGRLAGSVSALYTQLDNRRVVNFVNDGQGGTIERVNIVSTESYGLEATVNFRIMDHLLFDGNVTWQEHEFTAFDTNPLFISNELPRQPNVLYNAGFYYNDGRFDAALFNTYTGTTYTGESNAILLDAYNIARLDAGYTFAWSDSSARIGFDVYNLFDSDGITEGSPRQDTAQTTGGAFFVGRPVLPRRWTVRFTYDF